MERGVGSSWEGAEKRLVVEDGYGKQAQCQRNQRRNGQIVRRKTT